MKHLGETLKKFIEENELSKSEVAKRAGITRNYLSAIFKKRSLDADLLEKLCVATGLHPSEVFDLPDEMVNSYKDIWAQTFLGNAQVHINANENLRDLLAEKERIISEKERTIQILMQAAGMSDTGQIRDKDDK